MPKNQQPKDSNEPALFWDGLFEKYLARPNELADITLPQLFAHFEISRRQDKMKPPSRRPLEFEPEDNLVYVDAEQHGDEADGNDGDDDGPAYASAMSGSGRLAELLADDFHGDRIEMDAALHTPWGTPEDGFNVSTCKFAEIVGPGYVFLGGKYQYKLRQTATMVTWPFVAPTDEEEYCHMFAILSYPWLENATTSMRESAAPDSKSPYFDFCARTWPDLFEESSARHITMLTLQRSEAERAGISFDSVTKSSHRLLRGLTSAHLQRGDYAGALGHIDNVLSLAMIGDNSKLAVPDVQALRLLRVEVERQMDSRGLNIHQDACLRDIVKSTMRGDPQQLLAVFGGAGSGKSFLLDSLLFQFSRILSESQRPHLGHYGRVNHWLYRWYYNPRRLLHRY